MIDEDIESSISEDGLSFLEIINYPQYFLIIYGIITFGYIKRSEMESGGIYDLMILFLSVIISYDIITNISDNENRIRIIIENRSIDGDLFHKIFNISESPSLYLLSF